MAEYSGLGARFAKWRAVFSIAPTTPGRACMQANAHALARYAALCQGAGRVPIVEPEVLMVGDHTLSRCGEVAGEGLSEVFAELRSQGVVLEGMLLKPHMVLAGASCAAQESAQSVADATIACLRRPVPAAAGHFRNPP